MASRPSIAQAWVATEISGNRFTIRSDRGGVKVSWQVTGIRQDAWAKAHRLPNEVEKSDKERGHYIHPELFGHAGEPSVMEINHPSSRPHPKAELSVVPTWRYRDTPSRYPPAK